MLIARGVVTEAQLEEALQEQLATAERLGTILVNRGYLKEVDLVRILAEHFGLDFVDLEEHTPDPSVVRVVKESFARYHQLLPFGREKGQLHVAMVNPTNVFSLDDVRSVTGESIRVFMAEPNQLLRAIDRMWGATEADEAMLRIEQDAAEEEEADAKAAPAAAEDAPVIQFVNQLIMRAVTERASDIHLDPTEREMRVRFRIDGVLHEVMNVPRSARASVVSRLKIMAEINIAERRVPQDGRIALNINNRPISLRLVTLPTPYGEAVVIRVLEESGNVLSLTELGMTAAALKVFEASFRRPWGAIIVTGPTGSGKSTTMYATLAELNHPSRNIITVEDPIEYRMGGVKQMQVNRKAGLSFPSALRSILRADPDVVMVGEMRDAETAQIACEAALTGHLVITSLHTNDAASTPIRLLDMGIEPFMVTSALNCIVAQRLARRLCERCKAPYDPTADEAVRAVLPEWVLDDRGHTFFKPVGCVSCSRTGYRGRLAIHEVLEITPEIDHLIVSSAVPRDIQKLAIDQGMITMREDGLRKAASGETSLEEILRAVC
ncbi:MAG: Flp pilus assembly complex ATPase component TadA [Actinobacteria bacterium]|nr:Flp pilus assembly complex ATPase component TadA [Actinomycetota bacterium]MBW3650365.1 Flp pilus assembly complex ATPase component TadA [Actinomycetota bacterium]